MGFHRLWRLRVWLLLHEAFRERFLAKTFSFDALHCVLENPDFDFSEIQPVVIAKDVENSPLALPTSDVANVGDKVTRSFFRRQSPVKAGALAEEVFFQKLSHGSPTAHRRNLLRIP